MSLGDKILVFERTYDEISRRMPLVEGKTFQNEDVYLDFTKYDHCKFLHCELIIKYGVTSLTNNTFDGCRFSSPMGCPASLVVQLERMLRTSGNKSNNDLSKFR